MSGTPTGGAGLEARIQRVFLAQGSFSERRLWPSATKDRRMLATDIDVLVSEYISGFHVTRRHIECKGGDAHLLDRILWLSGVRNLLGADSSYLVGADLDLEASEFARSLNIQLIPLRQVELWEASLGIETDLWPCRSDFQSFDSARHQWQKISGNKDAGETWRFLRDALAFIEVESWLSFQYRYLNKLLRLLDKLSKDYEHVSDKNLEIFSRYVYSALLVRLSQYLLTICLDLYTVLPADRKNYLFDRLTFGDQDPANTSALIQGTISWVRNILSDKGTILPPDVDVGRLHAPPSYAEDFVHLIDKLLQQSNHARHLPISMEVCQFGDPRVSAKFPLLQSASESGKSLAAFVKGFVVRAFAVPKNLTSPVQEDLAALYKSHVIKAPPPKSGEGKLPFNT